MKSLLFYALIASQLVYFHAHYDLSADYSPALLAFAHEIRDRTKPDDVILIYGGEWNPSIAYYAERKAVMLPASLTPLEATFPVVDQLGKQVRFGAVVRCPCQWDGDPRYEALMAQFHLPLNKGTCEVSFQ